MKIYHGVVRNLSTEYIRRFGYNQNYVLVGGPEIVRENTVFYQTRLQRYVSLEYGTRLPSYDEAYTFLEKALEKNPNCNASCLFANPKEVKEEEISKEAFKQLKKEYRQKKGI